MDQRYLEIILLVDGDSRAEDVAHDDKVRLGVVYRNAVHSEELRQQRLGMVLYNVLQERDRQLQIIIMSANLIINKC